MKCKDFDPAAGNDSHNFTDSFPFFIVDLKNIRLIFAKKLENKTTIY